MKKVLLLLTVMILLVSGVTAYAAELTADSQTAQSTVYCLINSTFSVVIPKNIDCNAPFKLTAGSMNLRPGEQVNVYLNNGTSVALTNENSETINAVFTANGQETNHVGAFGSEQLESSIEVTCTPSYDTTPRAGTYKGTVEFIVKVEAANN